MLLASGFLLFFVGFTTTELKKGGGEFLIIGEKSKISIEGNANVVNYGCAITNHNWGDTIFIERQNDSVCRFLQNELIIPVVAFECDNSIMTEDFKETLNSKRFPEIILAVDQIVFKCGRPNTTLLKAELTIGGKVKQIQLFCQQSRVGEELVMTGAKKLTFSEFDLVPPEKFFGMVKVKDDITIFFNLYLRGK